MTGFTLHFKRLPLSAILRRDAGRQGQRQGTLFGAIVTNSGEKVEAEKTGRGLKIIHRSMLCSQAVF